LLERRHKAAKGMSIMTEDGCWTLLEEEEEGN
jgi:hypothetical protein